MQNRFGAQGAKSLFSALGKNDALKKLSVDTNSLDIVETLGEVNTNVGKTFNDMIDALPNHLVQCKLVELDVSLCSMGDSLGSAIATFLGANQQHSLRLLNASHNSMSDKSAGKISQALATNNSLQVLLLDGNFFGLEGTLSIVDALSTNKSLIKLSLLDCTTGLRDCRDEGAASTPESVKNSKYSTTTKLWQRNWGGVSKELEEAAMAKWNKWKEDEIQREYEEACKAAEEMAVLNPKKKLKKPKPPKKAKPKKAPKKGAKPDKTPIPKRFFVEAAFEAEEIEKKKKEEEAEKKRKEEDEGGGGGGKGGAKKKKEKKAAPPKKGAAAAAALIPLAPLAPPDEAAVPMSWQKKMNAIKRAKLITERSECAKMFWFKVRKSVNQRGTDCEVVGLERPDEIE